MGMVHAPFTPEQIASIEAYQTSDRFHSLTCGIDSTHSPLAVTSKGLVCIDCMYTQTAVLQKIADGSWNQISTP